MAACRRSVLVSLGRRRLWFAISAVALALAIGGVATRGLNYGLDFSGGRLIEYEATGAGLDAVRDSLADRGLPRAVVQRSGEGNVVVRTGKLTTAEEQDVLAAVQGAVGEVRELRDEFVGPTVGTELRRKALVALGLALVAQLIYLAVRFRWTYAIAAVIAMFHDVIILLGVFAWIGKELDAVFLAALLTVIGYSINDSVVVFDRIREARRARAGDDLVTVVNDACLETIPRTVNTGLGALFILVTLYFLGGETLTDFALALVIGIVVGTYSSVFTAAPLAVAFERPTPTRQVQPVGPLKSRRDQTDPEDSPQPSLTDDRMLVAGGAAPTASPRPVAPRPRKNKRKGGRRR